MQGFLDVFDMESAYAYSIEMHFSSFEQHALSRYAKIYVHPAIFGDSTAHNNECMRFGALGGKVKVGESTTKLDVWQYAV
jgi:hypothetical protein